MNFDERIFIEVNEDDATVGIKTDGKLKTYPIDKYLLELFSSSVFKSVDGDIDDLTQSLEEEEYEEEEEDDEDGEHESDESWEWIT